MKYDVMILSGGFDPVHVGHLRMIQAAAEMADEVVVGVNSDDWLMRKKGYVFMPWDERLAIIVELESVYGAVKFDDDDNTADDLIKKVCKQRREAHPECRIAFGNGGDRVDSNTPEAQTCFFSKVDMVWELGGDYKAQSSSSLVEKWRKNRGETT